MDRADFRLLSLYLVLFLVASTVLAQEPVREERPDPGPNPYLSFLPVGAVTDFDYWAQEGRRRAAERRARQASGGTKGGVTEAEPNDSQATANVVADFGTGVGETAAVDISGTFAASAPPSSAGPFAEDEGAIPLATELSLVVGGAVVVSGTIGDGPFGSGGTGTGDVDFFKIPGVERGQLMIIDVNVEPKGLDTFIGLYDSAGNSLALNEDEDGDNRDSFLAIAAPFDDDFYVSVAGSLFPFASILSDPFDSSTGFGVGSEGGYEVVFQLEYGDADWFEIELEACDILGVHLVGGGRQVMLRDPKGEILVASAQDLSGLTYPDASPLPGGGQANLAHVAAAPGVYGVRAFGTDDEAYTLELRVFRQPFETSPVAKRLFVDFDGATFDPSIFGEPPGEVTLSPLASFLSGWGLSPGDEDAVIDATLASLRESLATDPANLGPNGSFDLEILNSRDHTDPFGEPGVSRLIIGGSIGELGLPTIGIAQSIDVGNFESSETAVVLLDLLSGPAPDPNSLNTFPLADGAEMVDFVGVALGNIAAHEAGHYTGNFHTEQFDPLANIMDRGGNLPNTLGVGPDGTFGSADDVDVDFGPNLFEYTERFVGTEDTLTVVACGCPSGRVLFRDGFETGDLVRWSSQVP